MSVAAAKIEIRYRPSDSAGAWQFLTATPGQDSIALTNVQRGVSYRIEARSVSASGSASAWVAQTHVVADVTLLPLAPTGLAASSVADGVALSWAVSATQRPDVEYEVWRTSDLLGAPDPAHWQQLTNTKALAYTDPITDGVIRWYRVRAHDFLGHLTAYTGNINSRGKTVADGATVGATIGPGGNVNGAVDASGRAVIDYTSGHLGADLVNGVNAAYNAVVVSVTAGSITGHGPCADMTDSTGLANNWTAIPNSSVPAAIVIDLGTLYHQLTLLTFTSVWPGDARFMPASGTVDSSQDNITWETGVGTWLAANFGSTIFAPLFIPSASARYIRLKLAAAPSAPAGQTTMSIANLKIYSQNAGQVMHLDRNIVESAGGTYLRMPGANMDAARRGLIDFTQVGHLSKHLGNLADDAGSLRFAVREIDAARRALIDFAQTHTGKHQDNIPDGSTYGRVNNSALTSNLIDIAKAGVVGKAVEMVRNPDFESGDRDWTKEIGWSIVSDGNAYSGSWAGKFVGTSFIAALRNAIIVAVQPGDPVMGVAMVKRTTGNGLGFVRISWLDSSATEIADSNGNTITSSTYQTSRVVATAPASAAFARIEAVGTGGSISTTIYVDQFNIGIPLKHLGELPDDVTSDRRAATANQKTGGDRGFGAIDGSNIVVAGGIDFARGYTGKHLGNLPDDSGSGRFAVAAIDGARKAIIDFASGHSNNNLDHVSDGTRCAWTSTGQRGAAVDSSGNLLLKNISQGVGSTVNPSTTSNSYSVIPEMTRTITTLGNKVLILFSGVFRESGSTSSTGFCQFALFRDGVKITGDYEQDVIVAGLSFNFTIAISFVDAPSAASHTYDARWAFSGGASASLLAFSNIRSIQAVELG